MEAVPIELEPGEESTFEFSLPPDLGDEPMRARVETDQGPVEVPGSLPAVGDAAGEETP